MKNVKTFDQLLDEKYGKKGSADRDQFDADSLAFRLGSMLKEARIEANLTQEESKHFYRIRRHIITES